MKKGLSCGGTGGGNRRTPSPQELSSYPGGQPGLGMVGLGTGQGLGLLVAVARGVEVTRMQMGCCPRFSSLTCP